MKTLALVVALLSGLCAVGAAQDKRHAVTGMVGGAFPLTEVDFSNIGGGKDTLGSTGMGWGVQYLYQAAPRIGVGAEVSGVLLGDQESDTIISGARTVMTADSRLIMGVARYTFVTTGKVQPYALAGLGIHMSTIDATAKPQSGFVWSDTGTTETRQLVDDDQSGVAFAIGAGMDIPLSDTTFIGLEGRFQSATEKTYDTTRDAVDTFGVTALESPITTFNLLVKAGYRF